MQLMLSGPHLNVVISSMISMILKLIRYVLIYIIKVFEIIMEDGSHFEQRYEVTHLLNSMKSFNFAFGKSYIRIYK